MAHNTVAEYVTAKKQQWQEEGWVEVGRRLIRQGKCIDHGNDVDVYIVTEHSEKLDKYRQYSKRVGCCG